MSLHTLTVKIDSTSYIRRQIVHNTKNPREFTCRLLALWKRSAASHVAVTQQTDSIPRQLAALGQGCELAKSQLVHAYRSRLTNNRL
jgi:hypothetical protein